MLFVNLADQGFGESAIRTGGELTFSCKNPQVSLLMLVMLNNVQNHTFSEHKAIFRKKSLKCIRFRDTGQWSFS